MEKFFLLIVVLFFGCSNVIPLISDSDSRSKINPNNDKYFMYFEQSFKDTITVTYDGENVFKKYVVTVSKFSAAKEVCKVDSIKTGKLIILQIGNSEYRLKPIQGYRYYYLTKFNNKVAATYSNVLRDYH